MCARKSAFRRITALFILSILASEIASPLKAASIVLKHNDPLNFGFRDTTPREPVGGNSGTTLGQQRLNVFNYAAQLWGRMIHSRVNIDIEVSFVNLSCNGYSALLGAAGAARVFANFPKAPVRNVWYPSALANALEGRDISPADADITAEFNALLDHAPDCLKGRGWYYGLDHEAGSSIDFLNVLMHEFAHGFGIQAFIDGSTGKFMGGRPGIYDSFVRDLTQDLTLPEMDTDERRRNTMINAHNVAWDGTQVTTQAWSLASGTGPLGRVLLYAPTQPDPGAAISHWDTTLWPEALMEPFLSPRLRASENLDITLCMLQDIGWTLTTKDDCLAAQFGPPQIQVSPGVVQFGEVGIGSRHFAETWISNDGDTLLSVEEVAINDALSAPFSIHSQTCDDNAVAPGNSCSITVEFYSNSVGEFDDDFDVRSNDPDTPVLNISVRAKSTQNNSNGSGGGCVLKNDSGNDPVLTLLVLLSTVSLWLNSGNRKQHNHFYSPS